jgi:8-oxo-dGTP diphosphatase
VSRRILTVAFMTAHQTRRVYWRLVKPRRFGVKVAVTRGPEILLVRHTYAPGWALPGGGYRPGRETPEQAGRREVRQEVGIEVGDVGVLGTYQSTAEHKRDTITCLWTKTSATASVSSAEISEVRWFPVDALPDGLGSVTDDALRVLRRLLPS